MATKINWNEVYFQWWIEELESQGLVLNYEREPEPLITMEPNVIHYKQHYKKKEPIWKSFNLNRPLSYTCDYKVKMNSMLINKLIAIVSSNKTLWDYTDDLPGTGDFTNVYQETLFFSTEQFVKDVEVDVYFDVKPPSKALAFSGKLGSSRDFRFNQALVYNKHGIWVNKVVPIELFDKTFMPKRYRYTDVSGKPRKLNKKFKTLEEWLSLKKITKIN